MPPKLYYYFHVAILYGFVIWRGFYLWKYNKWCLYMPNSTPPLLKLSRWSGIYFSLYISKFELLKFDRVKELRVHIPAIKRCEYIWWPHHLLSPFLQGDKKTSYIADPGDSLFAVESLWHLILFLCGVFYTLITFIIKFSYTSQEL